MAGNRTDPILTIELCCEWSSDQRHPAGLSLTGVCYIHRLFGVLAKKLKRQPRTRNVLLKDRETKKVKAQEVLYLGKLMVWRNGADDELLLT